MGAAPSQMMVDSVMENQPLDERDMENSPSIVESLSSPGISHGKEESVSGKYPKERYAITPSST